MRLLSILLTLAALGVPAAVQAQNTNCDFSLRSQAEVDAFDCTDLVTGLYIRGSDITNLDGLNELLTVGGDLEIDRNTALTSIDGLSQLVSVGGFFDIGGNAALTTISGLDELVSVGGFFDISGNAALTMINGLAELGFVGGNFTISSNALLTSLTGFAELATVAERFRIGSNVSLTVLSQFPSLTSVGERVSIDSNDALTQIGGFSALTSVGENFRIASNDALANVSGFTALSSVDGDLTFFDNGALTSLGGFPALASVGGEVSISANALVTLDGFTALTSIGDRLLVSGNTALTSLDGFTALTSTGGNLSLTENDQMTDIDGLAALTTVGDRLLVTNNDVLANVDGLSALSSVGGDLQFSQLLSLADVDGLAALTSVGGNLVVTNNAVLTGLDGLAALASVGGDFDVNGNDALANLNGFDALTTVTGDITINENDSLASVDGFAALTTLGEFLSFVQNPVLTGIGGFTALPSIGEYLLLDTNTALASIDGFTALTSLGGSLLIGSSSALLSFDGFAALETIGGDLTLFDNDGLTDLDGLSAITTIDGQIFISGNDALTNLDGLADLRGSGGPNPLAGSANFVSAINVTDNSQLVRCSVGLGPILAQDQIDPSVISGATTFSGNEPTGDCNSVQDILDAYVPVGVTVTSSDAEGWRMLAAPTAGLTVQSLAEINLVGGVPGDPACGGVLNLFTGYAGGDAPGTAGGYVTPGAYSDPLVSGRGFFWYFFDDAADAGPCGSGATASSVQPLPIMLSASGASPTTDVTTSFAAAERVANDDTFYLAGNPFGEGLDLEGDVGGLTSITGQDVNGAVAFQNTVQVWDPSPMVAGNPVAPGYVTRTAGADGGTDGSGGTSSADDLSVWQGVWLERSAAASPAYPLDVTYLADYRTGDTSAGLFVGKTGAELASNVRALRFEIVGTVAGQSVYDGAASLVFADGATADWDAYDATKLDALSSPYALVAPVGADRDGALVPKAAESLPFEISGTREIQLSYLVSGAGDFELRWPDMAMLSPQWTVSLTDAETGETVDLRASEAYAFTSGTTTGWSERFTVSVTGVPVDSEDRLADGVVIGSAFPNPARSVATVNLEVATAQSVRADVFNMLGQHVATVLDSAVAPGAAVPVSIDASRLAAGSYVVRITGETFVENRQLTVVR